MGMAAYAVAAQARGVHQALSAGVDLIVTNEVEMVREAVEWRLVRCGATATTMPDGARGHEL
jgi:hypothetical protein